MLAPLLRYSLFGGPLPTIPKETDWEHVLQESLHQAVGALVYDAVVLLPSELQPDKKTLIHWDSVVSKIEEDYEMHAKACSHLQQLFGEQHPELGIRPLPVVKGLKTASFYPRPNHRVFGDIDLFSGSHTDTLTEMMQQRGIEVDTHDSRHTSFYFENAHFEAHRHLLYSPADRVLFQHRLENEGGLSRELHALFVVAHMERHALFFNEGLEMKDLVDWGLMVQALDYPQLMKVKDGFEVEHFADLLTHYCCQLWALPLPEGCPAMPTKAITHFNPMFVERQKRSRWALNRVLRRSAKYLRYNRLYRSLYGSSMFKRFYLANVKKALGQMIRGTQREVRQ